MIRALKYVGTITGSLLIAWFLVAYFTISGFSSCENSVVKISASPDKKWKLVLFERSCGATTGFSSQILLLKIDEEINNESGNIYISKGDSEGYSINWQSNTSVSIGGSNHEAFKKETFFNGINFDYK